MRTLPPFLALAFVLSLAAAPAAEARMGSSFNAALTKYDVRAAAKAKRSVPRKPARPASVELPAAAKGGLLFGDPEATTTIVMFTDIECPFCKRFHEQTYPSLKKDYVDPGTVRFVIRHFPLAFHPYASPAARAVVCARQQDDAKARFLYEKLIALKELNGKGIAAAIAATDGLDAGKIEQCVAGADAQAAVDADLKAGSAAKVAGTPSFLIIGPAGMSKKIDGAYPFDSFVEAIDAVRSGTK